MLLKLAIIVAIVACVCVAIETALNAIDGDSRSHRP